jgi:magnesium transporter
MSRKNHHRRRRWRTSVRRRTAPGASPGTIAPDPEASRPIIQVLAYGEEDFVERRLDSVEQAAEFAHKWPVVWINVDGLGDAATVEELGQMFNLHRLALEDVVNVHQRAKVEQYAEHLFLVARMVEFVEGRLASEQMSVFLGPNWVLTFQERLGDCFGPVRERIRQKRGRIRSAGPDYLAYALIDAVVDNYFPALERYGERLDELEAEVMAEPTRETVDRIHEVRSDLLLLRRSIWPHREAMAVLARDENPLITPETRIYFRDCYDHTIQIIDLLEADRELCSDLRDFYLSVISNRMNEVMKLLTIIATIFIPLSFIAGVYGMNFDSSASPWNMPELHWRYGYPVTLIVMAVLGLGMLYYFWRKGWLSD